jgi:hypothetical protein
VVVVGAAVVVAGATVVLTTLVGAVGAVVSTWVEAADDIAVRGVVVAVVTGAVTTSAEETEPEVAGERDADAEHAAKASRLATATA